MTLEYLRDYCLSLPGVTEDTPFDATTLCFRVGGKIFAIMDMEVFEYANLKCDPERAIELRERYAGITPGYHMNKKTLEFGKHEGKCAGFPYFGTCETQL
ncbi:MmcQ/YjbR family DNA-binding protein [Algoriphagus boritolerans]|uniref:MmcQ/YjbR family DNA-binding protein n=1 Tax=Algoriphagus boritolerans TaxID=308111 RepID=UPI000ACFCAAF